MANKGIIGHYSPEDISVIIAGIVELEGFSEGSFITVNRESPLFQTRESADGVVSRAKIASNTYTVKMSLMGTSESNELLTRLALLDHSTHIVKFPLFIKDELGKTLIFSTSSWVESVPTVGLSTAVDNREWVIKLSQATMFVGGNEEKSGRIEDVINTITGLAPSLRRLF